MNNKEYLDLLMKLAQCNCDCEKCPPSAPTVRQYEQTLARFNDMSSHTAANLQQTQAQLFATWGASMISLQEKIIRGE